MPRTTRRAARAAEDEATTTIHLDEDVALQIASAVNNFASTACDGVLQENLAAANETWKKASGTRKGAKKGKKPKADADMGSEGSEKENVESSNSGTDAAPYAQSSATPAPLTPAQFDKQTSDKSCTSSGDTTRSFEAPVDAISEAARNLESLFQQNNDPDYAEKEAGIAEIIARSPSKNSPRLDAGDDAFKMKSLQQAISTVHAAESCLPSLAQNETKAEPAAKKFVSSARAIPKAATPVPRDSRMSPTKASLAKEVDGKGTVEGIRKRSAISALHTPPPITKSSKPVTKSTFKLPGEDLSFKFKAQREERLKRMEEATAARQAEIQARASIKSKPVDLKRTVASRARQSILPPAQSGTRESAGAAKAARPKPRASTVNCRANLCTINKARAGVSGTERKIPFVAAKKQMAEPHIANETRARLPAAQPRGGRVRAAVSPHSIAQQKAKGRENFQRARSEQKSQEQVIKEQAEAARKARAEAAERGRQASREWAEKMKARKSRGPTGLKATESVAEH